MKVTATLCFLLALLLEVTRHGVWAATSAYEMETTVSCCYVVRMFSCFLSAVPLSPPHEHNLFVSQREEILASRQKRSKQIENMLEEAKQRLNDHKSGTRVLTDTERTDLEKKIGIYQRKLDTLTGDLDEREVERLIRREKLRNERLKERRARRSEL